MVSTQGECNHCKGFSIEVFLRFHHQLLCLNKRTQSLFKKKLDNQLNGAGRYEENSGLNNQIQKDKNV